MDALFEQHPYLLLPAFVVLWFTILAALARVGGWSSLADSYRSDDSFHGATRFFQSISIGGGGLMDVGYGSCVNVGANSEALRLSIFIPFRPSHPPLVIPFADLTGETVRKLRLFQFVRLSASKAPETKITVPHSLGRWIAENSSGAWALPEPLN